MATLPQFPWRTIPAAAGIDVYMPHVERPMPEPYKLERPRVHDGSYVNLLI